MNSERIYKVLLSPHVSEKAALQGDRANQVVFRVAPDATKPEIRQAVETLFEVKVDGVNIVNIQGKRKRFGRFQGRRNGVRKAYVRLAAGQEIDFVEGGAD